MTIFGMRLPLDSELAVVSWAMGKFRTDEKPRTTAVIHGPLGHPKTIKMRLDSDVPSGTENLLVSYLECPS